MTETDTITHIKENIYNITPDISIREAVLELYKKYQGQYFDAVLVKDGTEIHVLKSTENIIFIEDYPCPLCDKRHKATIHEDSKLFINCENTRIYYIETDEEQTIIPRFMKDTVLSIILVAPKKFLVISVVWNMKHLLLT